MTDTLSDRTAQATAHLTDEVRAAVQDVVREIVAPEVARYQTARRRAERSYGNARVNRGIRFNDVEEAPILERMEKTGEDFASATRALVAWGALNGGVDADLNALASTSPTP